MMLVWSLWLPRPILGLKESACGDDGAPAAMMLAQQIDMQWYCVELARSFNDLSTVIANGDYLHDKLCFILLLRGRSRRQAKDRVIGRHCLPFP
jgi:hypothetical protein